MRDVSVALGIGLLVVGLLSASYVLRQREPVIGVAEVVCAGPADAARRILVVGDSWARGGAVEAMAGPARVCALSYSGLTAADVLQSFAADSGARDAVASGLGGITDAVAIAGVNDAIQHRGAGTYAEGIGALAARLGGLAPRVFVLELPPVRRAPTGLAPELRMINALFACLNDRCAEDVVAPYRAAAANLPVTWIRYDDGDPRLRSFVEDGVHLTQQGSATLGRVIAAAVAASR